MNGRENFAINTTQLTSRADYRARRNSRANETPANMGRNAGTGGEGLENGEQSRFHYPSPEAADQGAEEETASRIFRGHGEEYQGRSETMMMIVA